MAPHDRGVPTPLLGPIFASAGLGALIGLIRQWSEQAEHGGKTDFGGVRTHTLWAILGCLGAVASRDFTPLALPVVIIAVSALAGIAVAAVWNFALSSRFVWGRY